METLFLKCSSNQISFLFCEVLYSQQQQVSLAELQAYIWQFYRLHFCFFAIALFSKKIDAIAVGLLSYVW